MKWMDAITITLTNFGMAILFMAIGILIGVWWPSNKALDMFWQLIIGGSLMVLLSAAYGITKLIKSKHTI